MKMSGNKKAAASQSRNHLPANYCTCDSTDKRQYGAHCTRCNQYHHEDCRAEEFDEELDEPSTYTCGSCRNKEFRELLFKDIKKDTEPQIEVNWNAKDQTSRTECSHPDCIWYDCKGCTRKPSCQDRPKTQSKSSKDDRRGDRSGRYTDRE